MLRKWAGVLMFLTFAASVRPQGLNVPPGVTKDDWEEINFEYNSSVLVDGFPSLLRMAELLQANPGYRVRVEGHTDVIGGIQYNDRLGLARANAVRDFLVKYGAAPGQIQATSEGKANPRYPGQKDVYEKTDEARYMNRRVSLTVFDAGGQTVSAGGTAAEAIRAIQQPAPAPAAGVADCCNEVLKRLDKLDDIAKMLKDLGDQNAALKAQLDALKAAQQVLESKVNQPPPPAPPAPPTASEVGKEVTKELAANRQPKFSLLGVNVGMDDTGNTTFSGKGQYFAPFGDHFAFQADAEYLYFKTDREGQFDAGLVDRIGPHFQAGLFGSMKYADLTQYQNGGTLGQGALTLDYIFKDGMIGFFGTKGFKNQALVSTVNATDPVTGALLNHLFLQSYLSMVDQAGISATLGLWGNNYLEGNAGYLHGLQVGNRFGGTARLIFPLNTKLAFTLEGDINESLVGPKNSGEAMIGMEFSNRLRPKELLAADHAVPVQVPRIRYEVITKKVRNGDDPPVANAGPNQIGVAAGPITLNGSASYSPDGNPITYKWAEVVGPPVTFSNPTGAITTFTAIAGETYQFELTVTDNYGLFSSAFVTVTTKTAPTPAIGFFTATPAQITSGKSTTLSWSVTNATSVVISGVNGTLGLTGSVPVSPTMTTTYTLTASNALGSTTAMVTVVVNAATPPTPVFNACYASPVNVMPGESSTLNWVAANATTVSIGGVSTTFGLTGSFAVTPTASTTYTLTASGTGGTTATCSIAVTVSPGQVPRIILFSGAPQNINAGQSATLTWAVENATSVSINNGPGVVALSGSQSVSPASTTTYTLTATNSFGSVTATATITVATVPLPVITSFTASPATSPGPGQKVTLTCDTTNAVNVNVAGAILFGANNSIPVFPTVTTSYSCIATNQLGQTALSSVTVVVPPSTGSTGTPPVVVLAQSFIQTYVRTVTLDASQSTSTSGNTPLTYSWTVAAGNVAGIVGQTTATPSVTVGQTDGEYDIEVTVTDSKGNSSFGVVRIMLVPNIVTAPASTSSTNAVR
jgi:hypothetical protein